MVVDFDIIKISSCFGGIIHMSIISDIKSLIDIVKSIINKLNEINEKAKLKFFYWGSFIAFTALIKPTIFFASIFKPLSYGYSALLFLLALYSFSLYLFSNKDMYKRQDKATLVLVITSLILCLCIFSSAVFNDICFNYVEINLETYSLQIKQLSYHNGLYNFIKQTFFSYFLVAFKFFQLFYFVYLLIQEYYLFNTKTEFLKRDLKEFNWLKFIIKVFFTTPIPICITYDLLTNIF